MVVSTMSDSPTVPSKGVEDSLSDEEYLIARARQAWKEGNVHEAKTWMLTARSIFPDNFGIQLEAYVSEKEGGNVKESAKYFQKLFEKFPNEEKMLAGRTCLYIAKRSLLKIDLVDAFIKYLVHIVCNSLFY